MIALVVVALALSAGPAAAAGRSEDSTAWSVGMELWDQLGRIGDWLHSAFLSDHTPFIDPNG